MSGHLSEQRPILNDFETEVARFCEEAQMVRPDPKDARAVNSFASWFVHWKHTGEVPRV